MAKKPAFETRMRRLEDIVLELEKSGLSLEESVDRYREGMTLYKELVEHLRSMEKKIEELTADGSLRPFAAAERGRQAGGADGDQSDPVDDKDEDEDA